MRARTTCRLRPPESIYGMNYGLTESMSVHDHYIPSNFHLAHLNSSSPDAEGGSYFTTFGQGNLGHFDCDGNYTVLASGCIGAHDARRSRNGDFGLLHRNPGRPHKSTRRRRFGTLASADRYGSASLQSTTFRGPIHVFTRRPQPVGDV